jgi:hypothetical protein
LGKIEQLRNASGGNRFLLHIFLKEKIDKKNGKATAACKRPGKNSCKGADPWGPLFGGCEPPTNHFLFPSANRATVAGARGLPEIAEKILPLAAPAPRQHAPTSFGFHAPVLMHLLGACTTIARHDGFVEEPILCLEFS